MPSAILLVLTSHADLVDVSEAEWRTAWLAIEHQVFDFIRSKLAAG